MLRVVALLAIALIPASNAFAAEKAPVSNATRQDEVRDAIHKYDDALKRGDAKAVGQFYAEEFVFINPRGERLTRADRLANLKSAKTSFDILSHAPHEESIRIYGNGDVAVYTTLLTIHGKYGGKGHEGTYRGIVVWVRRDGRWQQVTNQLTPVLGH